MPGLRTIVIAGASLTGAKAAEALRAEGFDGRVVLVGEEPARPYERPPLSKDVLRGDVAEEKVYVHGPGYYEENDIELMTSSVVTAIDRSQRTVEISSDGGVATIAFDRLLLATGSVPRRLDVPGADLNGVLYLRTLADERRLHEAIAHSHHVAVIGAGWIGSEVAASAHQMGVEVTLIAPEKVPLERVLGSEMGAVFRDLHADNGVELRMGTQVERLLGPGRVEEIHLSHGSVVTADLVVVGVGVAPRVELAAQAGLAIDDGVVTDEFLCSQDPGIFAAGDVASAWHPALATRVRLEHWSSALNQGPAAALNMLGTPTAYDRVPYFFSDQFDLGMEYTGLARTFDRVLMRGSLKDRRFIAFYIARDRVVAGMNVNTWDVSDAIARLVRSGSPVNEASLIDPDVDLATLAPGES
jgi:3-phenylpropionate/trans-cinnamate dioxygenase ferredoxin reductase subunit